MENTQKMEVNQFSSLKKCRSKFAWVLVLLLIISILIFFEFYGGKPELYRLF